MGATGAGKRVWRIIVPEKIVKWRKKDNLGRRNLKGSQTHAALFCHYLCVILITTWKQKPENKKKKQKNVLLKTAGCHCQITITLRHDSYATFSINFKHKPTGSQKVWVKLLCIRLGYLDLK